MSAPADAQQRARALAVDESFAVSAPAGSGKTSLLTQRLLTLLAHSEEPESILAITFTRKAAAEMQTRLLNALASAATEPEPSDDYRRTTWRLARAALARDQQQGWQLLDNPGRLRIQTIDGFCRSLTGQLPLESGFGATPDTLEAPQLAYQQAVRATLAELEQASWGEALAQLLAHLDNRWDRLEQLLIDLLAVRNQWLGPLLTGGDADSALSATLAELVTDTLAELAQWLQPWASDLAALADFAGDQLATAGSDSPITALKGLRALPPADPEALPQWQALAELLLTQNDSLRKQVDKRVGFPADKAHKPRKDAIKALLETFAAQPGLDQLWADVRALPPVTSAVQQATVLRALHQLLPVVVAQLKLVFARQGATDFEEITQAALAALGEADAPTDLALKLDYRLQHILVDEFQDTALSQWQLLERLTAGWQPGDGRTLFIVGDAMQSIYGFREANVGLFLHARRQGIGQVPLTPLDLTVNFRAQGELVAWVNDAFTRAFPARPNLARGAVPFQPAAAANTGAASIACVAITEPADADEPPSDPEVSARAEAHAVVAEIQAHRARYPEHRIAILVRSRGHLRQIVPALQAAGLRPQATDIDPLNERMPVLDLLSLTRALLAPDDRLAWLACLRAPWCGLSLADLCALAETPAAPDEPRDSHGYAQLWPRLQRWQAGTFNAPNASLTEHGQAALGRCLPIWQRALAQRGRQSLRDWVESTWLALGGPATLEHGALADAQALLRLLAEHDDGGQITDWAALEQAVDRLFSPPKADADPRLQIMTLHKAKGLEFEAVIIPGLHRTGRSDDPPLLRWEQRLTATGEVRLLLAPRPAAGEQAPLYDYLSREAKLQQRLEHTRLLYVGATRAIHRLVLLAAVGTTSKGDWRTPAENSLLHPLWPVFAQQMTVINAADSEPPAATSAQPTLAPLRRLPATYPGPHWPQQDRLASHRHDPFGASTLDDSAATATPDDPEAPAKTTARHTGTVLHRILQRITLDGPERWDAARIERQRPFWRAQLQQLGAEQGLDAALARIATAVAQILADPTGRWLLDHRHPDSACELALRDEQGLAVVDRTFIADGVRWVVDYKSAEPAPGQSLAHFAAVQSTGYRPQLQRYAGLLAALGPEPVRTALYFPLLAYWLEVDLSQS